MFSFTIGIATPHFIRLAMTVYPNCLTHLIRYNKAMHKRQDNAGLTKVSDILPQVIENLGIDENIKLETLRSIWHKVTDEKIAKYSQPAYFDKDGNLVISVTNSPLATELSMQNTRILQKLKEATKELDINFKSIRFIIKSLDS